MKRVKGLIDPIVGGLAGAVNFDIMSDVERGFHHSWWWNLKHFLITVVSRFHA